MTRPRILLTRRWPAVVEDHLAQSYDVTLSATDEAMTPAQLRRAMLDYDALCPTVTDRLDESLFVQGSRVRLVASYGAGYDHIDTRAAAQSGIVVTNTPDVLTDATAELAILLMLMVARRAGEGLQEVSQSRWAGWRPTHLVGQSLSGRALGLVGFGRIAQATARKAHFGLGMSVLYFNRNERDCEAARALGAVRTPDLETLLTESDVISLHCPGGPETRHLINADRLRQMKPGAILINTARGSVIDEAALAAALRANHISGAGLDVFEREPDVHPDLLMCDNAVLLPHLGSATVEARIAMGMRVAANLDRFFAGENPEDRVA